jgi:hypothetical protein
MRRDVRATIMNKSRRPLKRINYKLTHGKWRDGGKPDESIESGTSGEFQAGKQTSSFYGATGTVTYEIDGTAEFEIIFDDPYDGDNSASLDVTGEDKGLFTWKIFYNKEQQPLAISIEIHDKGF